MLEGNRFFPLTGMPIWKIARSSTLFAVWLPEPFTVATWRLKSLTIGFTGTIPLLTGSAAQHPGGAQQPNAKRGPPRGQAGAARGTRAARRPRRAAGAAAAPS